MLFPIAGGIRAELRPRLTPDPRFAYRLGDIPAASHPPLAAAMARLAGKRQGEVIWDPFCGSGLELIERARLGGVERLIGTDIDAAAIDIARRNLEAAQLTHVRSRLMVSNFKDYAKIPELTPGTVTLVISNPPMGRRLEVTDLRGLFLDLFRAATDALAPGGRLIFPNPLKLDAPDPRLQLVHRSSVDMGGYSCQLERWDRK
jgi:tRNA G10  N-methylase Trm11